MKLLHLADVHFDAANAERALASLAVAEETGRREKVDAFLLAGDLFHRGIQNSAAGRLPELIEAVKRLLAIAPVFAVSGTPTHDVAGCYAPLEAVGLKLLAPGEHFIVPDAESGEGLCTLMGLPEPSKSWLLAGSNGLSAEEANERVKAELRKILLGLGAARAEHPEIPAVMLYHGAIDGATLANGQLLEGGIALGREDLALVGADYYAMGHVHLAQQIPGLPAYYAGSAFPVDWAEVDVKGCNLVELEPLGGLGPDETGTRAVVTFVPFPHRARAKAVWTLGEPVPEYPVDGTDVWLVVRAAKGMAMSPEHYLDELQHDGCGPGSRVTIETIPTETVRAAEITERKHLREKVAVYAEASDELPPAESVLAKADELEADAGPAGAEAGAHLRIRKLRLRGATGIWKGLGVDEITLDLDAYDAGLVALIGPNGKGKSTLIENMHPWPCLLTREGKLQDHFRLRDSARELWFTDERDGAEYRALMLIDGVNATGKAEYHLFAGDTPLTNGRREDYEAAIDRLFGSLALFLRSAFVSQRPTRNNPDLAEATKGEKKAIFRELAGLDYLQAAAETAKNTAGGIESETELMEAQLGGKREALNAVPALKERIDADAAELEKAQDSLAGVELDGKAAASRAKELAAALEQQRATEKRIAEENAVVERCEAEAARARKEAETYADAVKLRPAADRDLAEYERLRAEEARENERAKQHADVVARIQSEYADAISAHRDHENEIQKRHSATQKEMVRLEGDRRVVLTQIDRLIADIATPEKACPQCGYIDPERAEQREEWNAALLAAQEKAHGLAQDVEEKRRELEAIEGESTFPPEKPKLPTYDETALNGILAGLKKLDPKVLRSVVERAQRAEVEIAKLNELAAQRALEARNADDRIKKMLATLDDTLEERAAKAGSDLEAVRQQYTAIKETCVTLRTRIDENFRRLNELEKTRQEIADAERFMEQRKAEAAEWQYLERAFGADGIQALELDALGPSIAEVANRLLSAAYGTRFSIVFKTTRIAGRGSKTKQVEDFSIWITDSERVTEQDLSTLSGGERVWIYRALYDSFAIIRDRNTGLRFLTCFADEVDGALDPEARQMYFAMLRAAHAESGRRHTLIVTHSEAAQEMIPQRIVMAELAKAPTEVAA
jgi:exonuclease SbcC